ncbi:MAG: hypothetical protein JWR03_1900 [Cohnella sp.]|jgi:hypothetical protein|nr:hypothetical protein [Cohnella sp.]
MKKIEEIKERLELRIKADIPSVPGRTKALSDFDEHAVHDIQYLLSHLETAEKALENLIDLVSESYDQEEYGSMIKSNKYIEQWEKAEQALQQIRE